MAPKAPPRPAVLQRATIDKEQRIDLVDVEGELGAAAVTRWTALLQGSIKKGVPGSPSTFAVAVRSIPSAFPQWRRPQRY